LGTDDNDAFFAFGIRMQTQIFLESKHAAMPDGASRPENTNISTKKSAEN
jgi:hypothetical protein